MQDTVKLELYESIDKDIENNACRLLEYATNQKRDEVVMFCSPQISVKAQRRLELMVKDLGWKCVIGESRQIIKINKRPISPSKSRYPAPPLKTENIETSVITSEFSTTEESILQKPWWKILGSKFSYWLKKRGLV